MDNLSEQMISTMSPDPYLYLTMQTNCHFHQQCVCASQNKSIGLHCMDYSGGMSPARSVDDLFFPIFRTVTDALSFCFLPVFSSRLIITFSSPQLPQHVSIK